MPCVVSEGYNGRFLASLLAFPRSAYELLTRQMVAGLSEDLREIRQRVNGLLFVTVTAVIADVVIRLTR